MTKCTICQVMGTNIRLLRAAYGYTQEHVAHEAGMAQGTYSKVESGLVELRVEAAFRIARLFQCSVEDLASPRLVIRAPVQKLRKAG